MITLYDMGPSNYPKHLGCSPHVRKIIFALNYKKIPFKLVPLPLDSIEPTAKSIGAAPTTTSADGSPKYTIPFIHDDDNDQVISDSLAIAKYLDEAYPDTPKLFAEGSEKAQGDLINALMVSMRTLLPIVTPKLQALASEEMKEARKRRGQVYGSGDPLTKEQETEAWNKSKQAFEKVVADGNARDDYVYANLVLAALAWTAGIALGEDSEEWREMRSWGNGRLGEVADTAIEGESQMVSA
ncbi:hypothetical protein PM082_018641 [Marasmius tenuissimus]|nr:hypothetical protein PM082_018641 [Marasmius tenuissimus]